MIKLKDILAEIDYHSKLSRGHKPDYYQLGTSEFKPFDEDMEENVDFSQIYTKHRKGFIEKVKKTEIGKSVYPKYSESFYRCYPDKPSNTVKENHGGVFIHYEKNRVITPRELARLQSFPDDFKFKGSKSCILVQLGNAVPCKLSLAIAKGVKKMNQ